MRKLLVVLGLAIGLALARRPGLSTGSGRRDHAGAGPASQSVALVVKAGRHGARGARRTRHPRRADDRRAVELFLRVRGWPQIKTGHYEIPARASPQEILRQLAEGRVVLETLTVIEGWTFADMRRAVEAHPQIKVMLRGKDDAEVMAAIGHAGEHPEGRFFPDTYRFAAGTTDRELFALAYRKMAETLEAAWSARARHLPLGRCLRGPDAGFDRREGNRSRQRTAAHRRRVHHAPAPEHAAADRSRR